MATVNLGRIKPVFRGAYSGSTAYVVDDIVTHGNETFICIQAGTGNATSNASYWTKLAAKGADGADGTNVATTLTTQGDILYRDGSGLQRLAAGTSGQVLQTGGSGANPSWGTVSSDFVKLATTTVSSAVSSVTFDGLFTSDYDVYKVFITDWVNSNYDWSKVNFRFGNTQYTSSNYDWTAHYTYRNSGNNNSGHNLEGGTNNSYLPLTWWGVGSSDNVMIELTIHNPLSTTRNKGFTWQTGSHDNGSTLHAFYGYGRLDAYSGTAMSGITFYANGNYNTTSGTFTMYGLKK
jgi:hypothetical protein